MLQEVNIMYVAIPVLNDHIAPCFEVAKLFKIFSLKDKKIVSRKTISCVSNEGFIRIRLLQLHHVNTLICNGIKSFYLNQLTALGVNVIPNISYTVDDAIIKFISGYINFPINTEHNVGVFNIVSHENLLVWAKELFKSNGYTISVPTDEKLFLVDLIAHIQCPSCKKQISVAICCGAHTYRTDYEIKEFHHNTKAQYDARVYVYTQNSLLEKCCNEYEINFVSPGVVVKKSNKNSKRLLPIIKIPIRGHEKAFRMKA